MVAEIDKSVIKKQINSNIKFDLNIVNIVLPY